MDDHYAYDGDDYLKRQNTQRTYQKQLGKIMQVLQGRVEKPYGKSFPNKFNPNQLQSVLKVELEDGTMHSIYGAPDQLSHCTLRQGDTCQIVFEERNGKTIRRLLDATGNSGGQRQQVNNRQPQQSRTASLPSRRNNPPVASTFPSKPHEPVDVPENVKTQATSLAAPISYLDEALKEQGYADVPFGEIRNLAVSVFINLDRSIHGDFVVKPPVEPQKVSEPREEEEEFEYQDEDYGFHDEDYDNSEQTDLF
jgi:hypothetical protein